MRVMAFLLALLLPMQLFAVGGARAPLPPEQAFALRVYSTSPTQAVVQWQIAPGYYLYRDQLHIKLLSPQQGKITRIDWPLGEKRNNSLRGDYQAYSRSVLIPIQLQGIVAGDAVKLLVNYQGCSQSGFCYPPMKTDINIAALTVDSSAATLLFSSQQGIAKLLVGHQLGFIVLVFLGLGLLLSFTPCVLPMVPILSGIIIGQGVKLTTARAFALSLTYVVGMAVTYAIAGLTAAWLGSSLQVTLQKPVFIIAVSGFFVLLAFSLLGWYEIRMPAKWRNYFYGLNQRQRGGTYLGVFAMGVCSTLIVSPCVSAPLIGVLTYIAETGDGLLGGVALLALGMGMGIPLLIIGVSAGKWLPKTGPWMDVIKKLFGILMLSMAIWMLSRVMTASMSVLLWGLFCLVVAILLFRYFSLQPFGAKLNKVAGVTIGLCGALLLADVGQVHLHSIVQKNMPQFVVIHDMTQLKRELELAKLANKPVMLDFYADWCASCVEMDKTVLSKAEVQATLAKFVLLRADVTANNLAAETLMKHYGVIAPPTILFFDSKGAELADTRLVGEMDAREFLMRVASTIHHS